MVGEVEVLEFFCLLEKFEVILYFVFDEGFDGDWFVDLVFGECVWMEVISDYYEVYVWLIGKFILEDFEVLDVCLFIVDVEFDMVYRNVYVNVVENLV